MDSKAKSDDIDAHTKDLNPNRWSKDIRNWEQVGEVWLNPEKAAAKPEEKLKKMA